VPAPKKSREVFANQLIDIEIADYLEPTTVVPLSEDTYCVEGKFVVTTADDYTIRVRVVDPDGEVQDPEERSYTVSAAGTHTFHVSNITSPEVGSDYPSLLSVHLFNANGPAADPRGGYRIIR
jgi:hypothetical protein